MSNAQSFLPWQALDGAFDQAWNATSMGRGALGIFV